MGVAGFFRIKTKMTTPKTTTTTMAAITNTTIMPVPLPSADGDAGEVTGVAGCTGGVCTPCVWGMVFGCSGAMGCKGVGGAGGGATVLTTGASGCGDGVV